MSEQTEKKLSQLPSDDFGNAIDSDVYARLTSDATYAGIRFLLEDLTEMYFSEATLKLFKFI